MESRKRLITSLGESPVYRLQYLPVDCSVERRTIAVRWNISLFLPALIPHSVHRYGYSECCYCIIVGKWRLKVTFTGNTNVSSTLVGPTCSTCCLPLKNLHSFFAQKIYKGWGVILYTLKLVWGVPSGSGRNWLITGPIVSLHHNHDLIVVFTDSFKLVLTSGRLCEYMSLDMISGVQDLTFATSASGCIR